MNFLTFKPAFLRHLQRAVAGGLSVVLFLTNVVFASAPEAQMWSERKKAVQLAQVPASMPSRLPFLAPARAVALTEAPLPSVRAGSRLEDLVKRVPAGSGTVRRIQDARNKTAGSPIVIHLQDVHQNADAQAQLRNLVSAFSIDGTAPLVALEGGSTEIDLSVFQRWTDRDSLRAAVDYLLKQKRLSGPIASLLVNANARVSAVGVEDEASYQANVRAYTDSRPRVVDAKRRVALEDGAWKTRAAALNPRLKEFLATTEAYGAGKVSFGDYVRRLTNESAPAASPTTAAFLKALTLEKSLDFDRVTEERRRLLERLVSKLSVRELETLTALGAAYQAGRIDHASFYGALRTACSRAGVALDAFPAMDAYIRYILLSYAIDGDALFEEIASLESACDRRLARTLKETRLVAERRQLDLEKKLVSFSLSPREWKAYRSRSADLSSFESFYAQADVRSRAMARNLLRAMKERRVSTAILVTGGFHSADLDRLLADGGCTTILITPKIKSVDSADGSAYLSVFAQDKTPLEKLGEGEKLFLSPPVWTPGTAKVVSVTSALRTLFLQAGRVAKGGILANFNAITKLDASGYTVQGGNVHVDVPASGLALDARFNSKGEFVSTRETVAVPLTDRILSPLRELPLTVLLVIPIFGPWLDRWFVASHPEAGAKAVLKQLIGVRSLRWATWTALVVTLVATGSLGASFGVGLGAHLITHLAFSIVFPESPLTARRRKSPAPADETWINLDEAAQKSKAMRAVPEGFTSRYGDFLDNPQVFLEATKEWQGQVRIDTSISNQGRSDYQGAIETLANAIDATIAAGGGEPIGRFGNGFRTILAVLKQFPQSGGQVVITTKTKGGAARVMKFRYQEGVFQVTWGPGPARTPQGTRMEVVLSPESKSGPYLDRLEDELKKAFSTSISLPLQFEGPTGESLINPLKGRTSVQSGKVVDKYAYPRSEVRVIRNENGFAIVDKGTGIEDAILIEKFLVPRSPTGKTQTGSEFDVHFRARPGAPSEIRGASVRITKGGRATVTVEGVAGRNLPDVFELILPPSAEIPESWDDFKLSLSEKPEENDVRRVTKLIVDSTLSPEDKVQVLNAWMVVLRRQSTAAVQSALKELHPWLDAMRKENVIFLPSHIFREGSSGEKTIQGFYSLATGAARCLFLDPEWLTDFSPDQVPGAAVLGRFGGEGPKNFEVIARDKQVALADFADDELYFEFRNVVYYNRRYFDPQQKNPAPVELSLRAGETSYEGVSDERRRTIGLAPVLNPDEALVEAVMAQFPFLGLLPAAASRQVIAFLKGRAFDGVQRWLERLGRFYELVSAFPRFWIEALVAAAIRGAYKAAAPGDLKTTVLAQLPPGEKVAMFVGLPNASGSPVLYATAKGPSIESPDKLYAVRDGVPRLIALPEEKNTVLRDLLVFENAVYFFRFNHDNETGTLYGLDKDDIPVNLGTFQGNENDTLRLKPFAGKLLIIREENRVLEARDGGLHPVSFVMPRGETVENLSVVGDRMIGTFDNGKGRVNRELRGTTFAQPVETLEDVFLDKSIGRGKESYLSASVSSTSRKYPLFQITGAMLEEVDLDGIDEYNGAEFVNGELWIRAVRRSGGSLTSFRTELFRGTVERRGGKLVYVHSSVALPGFTNIGNLLVVDGKLVVEADNAGISSLVEVTSTPSAPASLGQLPAFDLVADLGDQSGADDRIEKPIVRRGEDLFFIGDDGLYRIHKGQIQVIIDEGNIFHEGVSDILELDGVLYISGWKDERADSATAVVLTLSQDNVLKLLYSVPVKKGPAGSPTSYFHLFGTPSGLGMKLMPNGDALTIKDDEVKPFPLDNRVSKILSAGDRQFAYSVEEGGLSFKPFKNGKVAAEEYLVETPRELMSGETLVQADDGLYLLGKQDLEGKLWDHLLKLGGAGEDNEEIEVTQYEHFDSVAFFNGEFWMVARKKADSPPVLLRSTMEREPTLIVYRSQEVPLAEGQSPSRVHVVDGQLYVTLKEGEDLKLYRWSIADRAATPAPAEEPAQTVTFAAGVIADMQDEANPQVAFIGGVPYVARGNAIYKLESGAETEVARLSDVYSIEHLTAHEGDLYFGAKVNTEDGDPLRLYRLRLGAPAPDLIHDYSATDNTIHALLSTSDGLTVVHGTNSIDLYAYNEMALDDMSAPSPFELVDVSVVGDDRYFLLKAPGGGTVLRKNKMRLKQGAPDTLLAPAVRPVSIGFLDKLFLIDDALYRVTPDDFVRFDGSSGQHITKSFSSQIKGAAVWDGNLIVEVSADEGGVLIGKIDDDEGAPVYNPAPLSVPGYMRLTSLEVHDGTLYAQALSTEGQWRFLRLSRNGAEAEEQPTGLALESVATLPDSVYGHTTVELEGSRYFYDLKNIYRIAGGETTLAYTSPLANVASLISLDNQLYFHAGSAVYRLGSDGKPTLVHDYSGEGLGIAAMVPIPGGLALMTGPAGNTWNDAVMRREGKVHVIRGDQVLRTEFGGGAYQVMAMYRMAGKSLFVVKTSGDELFLRRDYPENTKGQLLYDLPLEKFVDIDADDQAVYVAADADFIRVGATGAQVIKTAKHESIELLRFVLFEGDIWGFEDKNPFQLVRGRIEEGKTDLILELTPVELEGYKSDSGIEVVNGELFVQAKDRSGTTHRVRVNTPKAAADGPSTQTSHAPVRVGTIDLGKNEPVVREFMTRNADFFQQDGKARHNLLSRLFYEKAFSGTLDDESLKILSLLPEPLVKHLSADLVDQLRAFVQKRSLKELAPFFLIASYVAPGIDSASQTRDFFERWVKLYDSLQKRRGALEEFLKLVDASSSALLARKGPIKDEEVKDTRLLLYLRYLKGDVGDILEAKDDPIPTPNPATVVGRLTQGIPLARVNVAFTNLRYPGETEDKRKSRLQDVKSIEEFEAVMKGFEAFSLDDAEKEIRSTVQGQAHLDNIAVRELIQNGRDAGRGKPVRVESFLRKAAREWVRRVTDTGKGMDLAKILGPLLVIEESDKARKEGVEKFAGMFGQGFYTMFADYDRVRIKTGTGDRTFYLVIEKGANGAPVISEFMETNEKSQGTQIEWVVDYDENNPPFLEALLFGHDLIRYVGAVRDSEIFYNDRLINDVMDAEADVNETFNHPDGKRPGVVRVSLSQQSTQKRVTQDGLFIMNLEAWMFDLVPPAFRDLLWTRGFNVDMPDFLAVTRPRTGFVSEERYRETIQKAMFVAAMRLAVQIYFKRDRLPPGFWPDFFFSREDPHIDPDVIEDARRINSGRADQIAAVDPARYLTSLTGKTDETGERVNKAAQLVAALEIKLGDETTSLLEHRAKLRALAADKRRENELQNFLSSLGKNAGAAFAGRSMQSASEVRRYQEADEVPTLRLRPDEVAEFPSLQRMVRFYERMLSVVAGDDLNGVTVGVAYHPFDADPFFARRERRIYIMLNKNLAVLKTFEKMMDEKDPHEVFAYFLEQLDIALHEFTHDSDVAGRGTHQLSAATAEEGEAPAFASETDKLANIEGFGWRLAQLEKLFAKSGSQGSWDTIRAEIARLPKNAPDELPDIEQELIEQQSQLLSPGSWAGLWLFVENAIRFAFGLHAKTELTPNEARWRFPLYGALEGALAIALWAALGDFWQVAAAWTAINVFLHAAAGVFVYGENGNLRAMTKGWASLAPNVISIGTGLAGVALASAGFPILGLTVSAGLHALINALIANLSTPSEVTLIPLQPVQNLDLDHGDRAMRRGGLKFLSILQTVLKPFLVSGPAVPLVDRLAKQNVLMPMHASRRAAAEKLLAQAQDAEVKGKLYLMGDFTSPEMKRWKADMTSRYGTLIEWRDGSVLSEADGRSVLNMNAFEWALAQMTRRERTGLFVALPSGTVFDGTGLAPGGTYLFQELTFLMIDDLLSSIPLSRNAVSLLGAVSRLVMTSA